ncbi:hypothetical protein CEP54_005292 [Fusarium duplospermum]|uniref:Uncharacterized protein n=1 Tax=Fusarium duplospermum TaxID=1325734 RepID=A0A428QD74_9HYPO|nr:hypothetical protein CEP54_005292 [Fusarium duplospermum]
MAEAISLIASVAGLLDVATRAFSALHNLQSQLRNAPDLIRALSNEAADLGAVLARVDDVRKTTEAAGLNTPDGMTALVDLEAQLLKAKSILADLDALAQKLFGEKMTLKRVKWCLKKSRASELQTRLKEVRLKINELLVAHNTSMSTRILLELRDIRLDVHHSQTLIVQRLEENGHDGSQLGSPGTHASASKEQSALDEAITDSASVSQEQSGHQNSATEPHNETRHPEQQALEQEAGERIAIIQRLVSDVLAQQTLRSSQVNPQDPASIGSTPVTTFRPEFLNSVLYFSLRLMGSRCSSNCWCKCHAAPNQGLLLRLPRVLRYIIGSLFVGYTGCPISRPVCNLSSCSKGRYVRLRFTYAFPLWFLNYAIHGLVDTTERFTLAIVPRRRMEYLSPMNILYQVQVGTMENIRHILQVNKSAVIEVYYGDDRSVLQLALTGPLPWTTKVQIIKLLLISGADPEQEDIFGTSARHQVGRMLLSRDGPPEYFDELERIFPLSGCIDDLGLTFLHKIVVGHCHVDLGPILESQSPEILAQLDAKDGSGRTPLMYATERGDLPKARALVNAGADVNIKSSGGSSALGFALDSDMPESTCLAMVDLFLEAGTDIDMVDERQGRNFMHFAAERNNAPAVKRLLAAGAKIDPQTAKMPATPLAFAARYNAVDVIQLLYEEGADINASQNNGITPLLMAVGFNAHQGQAMLLQLGADYLRDSQGTTVLHAAAESGDVKTLETLASFGLGGLDVEARDKNGLTAREEFEVREQPVTDEVKEAFYRLLEVVASHNSSVSDGQDSGSSDDEFVDAAEYGQEEEA